MNSSPDMILEPTSPNERGSALSRAAGDVTSTTQAGCADTTWARSFYDGYWVHRHARGDTTASNRVKLRHEQAVEFITAQCGASLHGRVLDLGCGDGIMGQLLTPRGFECTGIDVSAAAISLAGAHYDHTRIIDLDQDPWPGDLSCAFDAVVCLEVLEHLEHPQRAIGRAFDACRPGGCAVFSFPNMFSWRNRWHFLRGRWPHGYTTYDPREHLHVLELSQIRSWLREAGFEWRGIGITPDLPRVQPMRAMMFRARRLLSRFAPALWAMQINVFAERRER